MGQLRLNDKVYTGATGSGHAVIDTLWSGSQVPPSSDAVLQLSGNISDYDLIVIHVQNSSYGGDCTYFVRNLTLSSWYISTIYAGANLGPYWQYTSDTSITVSNISQQSPETYTSVIGIKL